MLYNYLIFGKRGNCSPGSLIVNLGAGMLTDSNGRVGCINDGEQFQFFDIPLPSTVIADAGWSLCSNGSLALNRTSTTIFWQCEQSNFFSIYDLPVGSNCSQVNLQASVCTTTGAEPSTTSSQSSTTTKAPTPTNLLSLTANSTKSSSLATTPTGPSSPENPGIVSSTKIGLGIGIGLGGTVLLSAILLWWLIIRRKARRQNTPNAISEPGVVIEKEPGVAVTEIDDLGVFAR